MTTPTTKILALLDQREEREKAIEGRTFKILSSLQSGIEHVVHVDVVESLAQKLAQRERVIRLLVEALESVTAINTFVCRSEAKDKALTQTLTILLQNEHQPTR